MGMDVFGRKPTATEGEYFRRNVWGWRPLAAMCQQLAPELTAACKYWGSNDGDGLNAKAAKRLAVELQQFVADGTIAHYIAARDAWLASLPDDPCTHCNGPCLSIEGLELTTNTPCHGCNGKGTVTPWARHYHLDEKDVEEWIAFLKACGGFRIY